MSPEAPKGYVEQSLPEMELYSVLASQKPIPSELKFVGEKLRRQPRTTKNLTEEPVVEGTQISETDEQTLPLPKRFLSPTAPKARRQKRVTFSTMATPRFWGLEAGEYDDITDHMLELVEPDRLRESLINVPRFRRNGIANFALTYIPGGQAPMSRRGVSIALPNAEFDLLPSDPNDLARRAVSKYHKETAKKGNNTFTTELTAGRYAIHLLEDKSQDMVDYRKDVVVTDLDYLTTFRTKAQDERLRYYMGTEADVRVKGDWVLNNIILGRMLEAIRYQREWREEQMDLARRSIQKRLFFERRKDASKGLAANRHIRYWQGLLDLSLEYTSHKNALFLDRIYQTNRTIRTYAQRQEQPESD